MHAPRTRIGWLRRLGCALAISMLFACGDAAKNDASNTAGSGGQAAATTSTGSGGGASASASNSSPASNAGSGANSVSNKPPLNAGGGSGTGGSTAGHADAAVPPVVVDAGHDMMTNGKPADGTPTLFWLDLIGNAVLSANADGMSKHTLTSGGEIATPDGVAVDFADGGHVYWTNMGNPLGGGNNGKLQRSKLDGSAVETIVPVGSINTPKQMTIDHVHGKLYFCDREGAKVWRANLDGSQLETLVSGHDFVQLVGIALDVDKEQFYFTDRMAKKIHRAGFAFPAGETADTRTDIEELFVSNGDSMPIDMDLDVDKRQMYWTDRVEGTVHRAGMDLPAGQTSSNRKDVETLVSDVPDAIGISLDLEVGKMYFGQLNGQLSSANLDGSDKKMIAQSGSVSGVAFIRVPKM